MNISQDAPKRQRSKPEAIILGVIASLENRFGVNETAPENIALCSVVEWLQGLQNVMSMDPQRQYTVMHNRDGDGGRVIRMRLTTPSRKCPKSA